MKVKEVELNYLYKLRDGYLDNARKMTGQVYIPISVALTNLLKGYELFAASSATSDANARKLSDDEFHNCCVDYLKIIDELLARGADAYLTLELDKELNEFTNFIRNSLRQNEFRKRVVLQSHVSSIFRSSPAFATEVTAQSWLGRVNLPNISINLTPFGLTPFRLSYAERILAAPVHSHEFDRAFRLSITQLKGRIKEVTLGANRPT